MRPAQLAPLAVSVLAALTAACLPAQHHAECRSPADCRDRGERGTVCDLGRCVECTARGDCRDGFTCEDTRCVPRAVAAPPPREVPKHVPELAPGPACDGLAVRLTAAAGDTSGPRPDLAALAPVAECARSTGWYVVVTAHADGAGAAERFLAESEATAAHFRGILVALGVEAERTRARGLGREAPLCREQTPECLAANRRVEVSLSATDPGEAQAAVERLERFPTVEAPERLSPGQRALVQVSLTVALQDEAPLEHTAGEQAPGGATVLRLPRPERDASTGQEKPWPIDVVLSAPGLQVEGPGTATLLLRRTGDTAPAGFWVRAKPGKARTAKLFVTFWHQGQFIAKVVKPLPVDDGPTPPVARAPPATPGKAAPPPATVRTLGRLAGLNAQEELPDATLTVHEFRPPGGAVELHFVVASRWLGARAAPAAGERLVRRELEGRLGAQLRQLSRRASRGIVPPAPTTGKVRAARDELRSIGRELRDDLLTEGVRRALATIQERWAAEQARLRAAGEEADDAPTLLLLTNSPGLPWELLLTGAAGREEFLGVTWRVARWHLDGGEGRQADQPPPGQLLPTLLAVAPAYQDDAELPAQAAEVAALREAAKAGFVAAPGTFVALRGLLGGEEGPRGIIHFAGHGDVTDADGEAPAYRLLLEDEPMLARGLREFSAGWSRSRPLVVLNACDVGEARRSGGRIDGWAPAVLDAGASGFVGGLWPLGDTAAADFSARFYPLLFEGVPVDEAVRRLRARFAETGDPTYMAYVFYGALDLTVQAP